MTLEFIVNEVIDGSVADGGSLKSRGFVRNSVTKAWCQHDASTDTIGVPINTSNDLKAKFLTAVHDVIVPYFHQSDVLLQNLGVTEENGFSDEDIERANPFLHALNQ